MISQQDENIKHTNGEPERTVAIIAADAPTKATA